MGANCCNHDSAPRHDDGRYRRILWIALLVNLAMFLVEIGAGLKAGSVSLLADSLDFLGDAANYGISLWVLGMALAWRARAAQLKAVSMLVFGLGVLGAALWHWWQGEVPSAPTMGLVGSLALLANVGVAQRHAQTEDMGALQPGVGCVQVIALQRPAPFGERLGQRLLQFSAHARARH